MNSGSKYLKDQALIAAANRLKKAATFTALNIKTPLFQKRMGKGHSSVLVRFEWPGVLSVIDPDTGELLAESAPGRPDVLQPGFVPPVPALAGAANVGS
ncbi:hypothetical protein GALL_459780 [mine drainage metagenome]|uniref:Uncharacterized protein n=1 Tax=mine drainage metagenome TaxID=410659 RepID=A0A1J5PXV2_9ZZZZ